MSHRGARAARVLAWAAMTLLMGVLLWLAARGIGHRGPQDRPSGENPSPGGTVAPRPFDPPFLNARDPAVRYVGSAACGECHEDIAASYARHPMGRSLAPMDQAEQIESLDQRAGNPLHAQGWRYTVRRDGPGMVHVEERIGPDGQPLSRVEVALGYAVGSGQRGRSYLLRRGDQLFLSPLTWYPQHGAWDLTPGFETANAHFSRPAIEACLFCHAHKAEIVAHSLNRYAQQPFVEHAIGCERCHGPGELHVEKQAGKAGAGVARGDAERGKADAAAGEDVTIANPARLPPPLREAVCEQCHLSGAARVVARGRTMHDFRPGLPLHGFVATFVETAANPARRKFVGQAEQMRASRCYQQSQGQLSCTSCHDPHAWPAVDAKLAFYRRRCLACHERQTCSLPEPQRLQKQPADDCTACHMPKQTTEVRHAAVSDHRVPRVPADEAPAEAPRDSDLPIRNFHSDQLAVGDREAERNLAIALLKLNDERHGDEAPPSALQRRHTRWAIETLQAALQRHPDDHDAAEVLARALADEGQLDDALRLLESLLAEVPRREFALTNAAALWMSKGRSDKALAYWHRAVQINPWMVGYRVELARVHGERRDWQTCRTHCREILETFPESFGARTLLVESLLALREPAEAEREFQKLLSFGPPKPENIRRWYEQHPLKR